MFAFSHYHEGMDIIFHPIGWVHSAEKGPREDFWGGIRSTITLDERQFAADAVAGLGEFSHVEVLFYFDRVPEKSIVTGKRHPRGQAKWPQVGIFAQRAKARPNRIGATICRLLSVEGTTLRVQGLDALDGTPVLDIKPVFAEFQPQSGELRQPAWSHEMMKEYFAAEKP